MGEEKEKKFDMNEFISCGYCYICKGQYRTKAIIHTGRTIVFILGCGHHTVIPLITEQMNQFTSEKPSETEHLKLG